jgi:hypothetical protein
MVSAVPRIRSRAAMDDGPQKFELPPFIPIFLGLDEHLWQGKFTPTSHSVYVLLLRHCNWGTGIYFGCAETLKNLYGGTAAIKQVADALAHLRKNQMINYRQGTGRRGSYNILVHKHLARVGALKGYRLNAFAENSLRQPLYEWSNGGRTEDGVSTDGGRTVSRLSTDGVATEVVHHQEVQEIQEFQTVRILEFKKVKSSGRVGGSEPEPPSLPDEIDLTFDAAAGLDRDDSLSSNQYASDPVPTVYEGDSVDFSVTPTPDRPDSEQLARKLFLLLKSPKKHAKALSAWSRKLAALLKEYSFADVAGTMDFGFTVDDFWPEKLHMAAGKDPCDYIVSKFPTILAKHRGRMQSAENTAKRKTQPKESTHGRQTHPGKTGSAKTAGNQDAVDETIEWLRKQQSGAE